jgi:hypothetical protein
MDGMSMLENEWKYLLCEKISDPFEMQNSKLSDTGIT